MVGHPPTLKFCQTHPPPWGRTDTKQKPGVNLVCIVFGVVLSFNFFFRYRDPSDCLFLHVPGSVSIVQGVPCKLLDPPPVQALARPAGVPGKLGAFAPRFDRCFTSARTRNEQQRRQEAACIASLRCTCNVPDTATRKHNLCRDPFCF